MNIRLNRDPVKFLALALLGFLCIGATGDLSNPGEAPLNPYFVQFQRAIERGTVPHAVTDDGFGLGERPAPVDLSHVQNVEPPMFMDSYAATYDLRTLGKLTPVKNQGSCGSCWTFGAYASLESYGKPLNDWNFSEQDMNATHGFDYAECAGGNHYMSTAYLARWSGPLSETDVPYPYGEGLPFGEAATGPIKHVQQVVFIPNRTGYLDNDTIKYFVKTFGAAYVSFFYGSGYMDATDENYYCNGPTGTNHAVAVVGWDDNYDKNNFKTTPPGNGAFLIRNSWGTARHDGGYFWLSYYDTSFIPRCSLNNAESPDIYETIYQYDQLGWVTSYGYSSPTAWGANIFTATNDKSLQAVSFYTTDSNTSYTVYVYTGVTAGQPRSGVMAASKSGSQTYPGYTTVELDTPVAISSGTRFSVVVRFTTSGYGYPLAVESAYSGYSSGATANPGESFISSSGSSWSDISASGYNGCIKAFAATVVPSATAPDFNKDGNTDIVWRYYATGGYNTAWLRGTAATLSPSGFNTIVPSLDQDAPTQIDPFEQLARFNADPDSHVTAASLTDPRNHAEASALPAEPLVNWRLSGSGDFNLDGDDDLLWRNLATGENRIWLMDGLSYSSTVALPTASDLNWVLSGCGDFNGDDKLDLVWRNMSDGRNAVWLMDGVSVTKVKLLVTASNVNWWLCGTGHFNEDEHIDLVWRNMADGRNAVWLMNGTTMTGAKNLPAALNLNWLLVGTGDFNNDGDIDLLWRRSDNGKNAIWYMNGYALTSIEMLTTVTDTNWMIEN